MKTNQNKEIILKSLETMLHRLSLFIIIITIILIDFGNLGATVLTNPTIIGNSAGSPSPSNIFDGEVAFLNTADNDESFVSNAGTNSYVEFDFGVATQIDGFLYIDRSGGTYTTAYDMTYSTDTTFGNGDDITENMTKIASFSHGAIEGASQNARAVRWDVTTTSNCCPGIGEMYFFQKPTTTNPDVIYATNYSVVSATTALAGYSSSGLNDFNAGRRGDNYSYFSTNSNATIVLDMGSEVPIYQLDLLWYTASSKFL